MVIPRAGGNGVQSVQFRGVRGQNWGEFGGRWPFFRTYTPGSFYPDHKPFLPAFFPVSRPNPQPHCLYQGSILSKAQITNRCGSVPFPTSVVQSVRVQAMKRAGSAHLYSTREL